MDLLSQIWITLAENKTRSFLTMFGIAWGLICLILLTAGGEGMWVAQRIKAKSLGENIFIVWGGITSKSGSGVRAGKNIILTLDDYWLLRQKATYIRRLSPEIGRNLPVRSSLNNGTFEVQGIFPDYIQMRTIEIGSRGRLISDRDNRDARRVCIIGEEVRDQLFNKFPALGESIAINGFPYLVIGELIHKDQNSNYGGPDNMKIFVPFFSLTRDFPIPTASSGKLQLSDLIVQPYNESVADVAELQVRTILAEAKGFDALDKDAVPIWNTVRQARFVHKLFSTGQVFLGAVAVVTLALGGIGVMNIMLLSVTERTPEIGIRKALGASNRDILIQFFLESFVLCLIAGLAGLAIGWGFCYLINQLVKIDFFAGMIITPKIGLMAFGFLALVGIFSSIYPAFMASVLNPVEALRYE